MTAATRDNCSARSLLPDAQYVTGRVTERRDPEIAFWIGWFDNLTTTRGDSLERRVDTMDIDECQYAWGDGYRKVRDPRTDHLPRCVGKAKMLCTLTTNLPTKVRSVESSGVLDVRGWNLQICESAMGEQVCVRTRIRSLVSIIHVAVHPFHVVLITFPLGSYYWASPTRRSKSWNRGSLRSGS